MLPSCAALIGDAAISRPSLFRRPNSSLITQFAAALASRMPCGCLGNRLEEFRPLAFGDKHVGVVG